MEMVAIVNAANPQLEDNGGVAIVEAGGVTIQADSRIIVESHGQIAVGDIAVTISGNLPCRIIIHAVTPTFVHINPDVSVQQLRAAITRILEFENISEQIETLTILAIGVGIFSFPVHSCASEVIEILMNKCIPPSICCLSEIRLISNEDRTVKAFKTACVTWTPPHDIEADQIEPLIPRLYLLLLLIHK
ncbi:protein mono-ADP-ribosyltransferase PARP9-like [Ranitomeya imitator]|uniref:protein mono-ADP-ribosyltransferase PARP9-like n=1 Tax=Ranitomeya imitator TaxID=111125 RepID=UPI0037E8C98E